MGIPPPLGLHPSACLSHGCSSFPRYSPQTFLPLFLAHFSRHLTPLLCSLQKDELYLNLVLEYVPETVYRVARHFTKAKLSIPIIYVKVGRLVGCRGPGRPSQGLQTDSPVISKFTSVSRGLTCLALVPTSPEMELPKGRAARPEA